MVERGNSLEQDNLPKGPAVETGAPEGLSDQEQKGASALASQGAERPSGAMAPDEDMLNEFAPPAQEGPSNEAPAPNAPAPSANRSFNELAKDPAVRERLQAALDKGEFKYDSLKEAVKTGLETGDFKFKSAGQESAVKKMLADVIKPQAAQDGPGDDAKKASRAAEAVKPGGLYDVAIKAAVAQGKELPAPANGQDYTNGEAKEMAKNNLIAIQQVPAITEALNSVDQKLPEGLDERVKNALASNDALQDLKNPGFEKGAFQNGKPALSDAVRYANQMAVKTGDFEPASIEANFRQAFEQPDRKALIKLTEDQGIQIYPDHKPAAPSNKPGHNPEDPIKAGGKYDRAIEAAKAKNPDFPAPQDPAKGYTNGEARKFVDEKTISLEENSQARQTPNQAPQKELAGRDDARAVIDYLNAGHAKDGKRGLPFDAFKALDSKSKNEVSAIVKALDKDPNANFPVTASLAKEFKEKVLKEAPANV